DYYCGIGHSSGLVLF
nr:immunoglobulin light chain junction region [Macaca mulatta]MOV95313.1 immunoglobulin light chain junction region [Macaca mulatta]MOV95521.1 immunoglobulin light chain junction region [Macaca mulatta]MOV95678.1 immunoglobulin light chain junction region [Macaca mulatta]MOV96293.1 immunoglobulin light chain junction region [Macaca mulatta]